MTKNTGDGDVSQTEGEGLRSLTDSSHVVIRGAGKQKYRHFLTLILSSHISALEYFGIRFFARHEKNEEKLDTSEQS